MAAPTQQIAEHPAGGTAHDLAAAVEYELWRYDPLRESDAIIEVTAEDGAVTLAGSVRTEAMKLIAAKLAGRVPGVRRPVDVDGLIPDSVLERRIAEALAADAEAALLTDAVVVKSILGTVFLAGTVAADEDRVRAIRDRAEALVRDLPGVRQVINEIRAV
jgi:osmotically-inducible protein OsmY